MATNKPRVYMQGATTYVIGTSDVQEAVRAIGISPTTHKWGSTDYGLYVRRRGLWRAAPEPRPPKAAELGVAFVGPIRAREV